MDIKLSKLASSSKVRSKKLVVSSQLTDFLSQRSRTTLAPGQLGDHRNPGFRFVPAERPQKEVGEIYLAH